MGNIKKILSICLCLGIMMAFSGCEGLLGKVQPYTTNILDRLGKNPNINAPIEEESTESAGSESDEGTQEGGDSNTTTESTENNENVE